MFKSLLRRRPFFRFIPHPLPALERFLAAADAVDLFSASRRLTDLASARYPEEWEEMRHWKADRAVAWLSGRLGVMITWSDPADLEPFIEALEGMVGQDE